MTSLHDELYSCVLIEFFLSNIFPQSTQKNDFTPSLTVFIWYVRKDSPSDLMPFHNLHRGMISHPGPWWPVGYNLHFWTSQILSYVWRYFVQNALKNLFRLGSILIRFLRTTDILACLQTKLVAQISPIQAKPNWALLKLLPFCLLPFSQCFFVQLF